MDYEITKARTSLTVDYEVDLRDAPIIDRAKGDKVAPKELIVKYRNGKRSEYAVIIHGYRLRDDNASFSVHVWDLPPAQRRAVDEWLNPILAELDQHMAAVLDNPKPHLGIKEGKQ